jgi:hypothetical protein
MGQADTLAARCSVKGCREQPLFIWLARCACSIGKRQNRNHNRRNRNHFCLFFYRASTSQKFGNAFCTKYENRSRQFSFLVFYRYWGEQRYIWKYRYKISIHLKSEIDDISPSLTFYILHLCKHSHVVQEAVKRSRTRLRCSLRCHGNANAAVELWTNVARFLKSRWIIQQKN